MNHKQALALRQWIAVLAVNAQLLDTMALLDLSHHQLRSRRSWT